MRHEIEEIYREHRQGLFTLALAVTRSPDMAEDAVQDAFARLWRLKSFPGGDKAAYVFAAVRNAAIDQLRRQHGQPKERPASIFDGGENPQAAAMDTEQVKVIQTAIDALDDPHRQTVVMRIYGGLTFEQMAEAFGEPLATVASRYRRSIEQLRQQLGQ